MNTATIIMLTVLAVFFISRVIPTNNSKKKDTIFLILAFCILFAFLFVRAPISDMQRYLDEFSRFNYMPWNNILSHEWEIGYKILNLGIGKITSDPIVFMHIIDFLSLSGFFFFIRKYSHNYLLAVLLYVSLGTYCMTFFIIRQALAISILAFSVEFIEKRKPVLFVLMVLLATCFHKTSIVFLIAYPACNLKINRLYIFLASILGIVAFSFKTELVSVFRPIFYGSGYENTIGGEGYGVLVFLFLLLSFTFFTTGYLSGKNKFKLLPRETGDIFNIAVGLTILKFITQIFATANTGIGRVSDIFSLGVILLCSELPLLMRNPRDKLAIYVAIVTLCFIWGIFTRGITGWAIAG